MRKLLAAVSVAMAALIGAAGSWHARSNTDGWREITWPFPRDGWPSGRAFHCAAAACGEEVEVYVRPKLGFCNCDSGVADDDEVDRVADLDMISPRFAPLEAGRVIRLADMRGRSRAYDLNMPDGSRHAAVGIAVSHRCDLVVAVAQGQGTATVVQRAALEFLGSNALTQWLKSALAGS